MPPPLTTLPIDCHLPQIVELVRQSRSLVLVAEPGAGKTTRVPPAILRAGLLSSQHPLLVMLQPRRIAARAAAQRIAEENGWQVGNEVGYHVRFDRMLTAHTPLRVLTEGILNRQLIDDPFLEGIGAVVLDEFHERSIHTDLAIALLKEIRQTVRPDLILIVMSATLEAEPVARFLDDCPILRAQGRTFPVQTLYAGSPAGVAKAPLSDQVAAAIEIALGPGAPANDAGDILVFLPGAEEIRRTARRIEALAQRHDLLVLPLHGNLPADQQTLVLRPARQRKIILATNIAETSLTIDGVRTVIDGGLARVASYDPQRGLDRLDLQRISKASAAQRAGRAGRTAPGRCIRLWSGAEDRFLDDFQKPEIRRVDLCGTVLALHAWGKTDARAFGWYEHPDEHALDAAQRLLEMLGALTAATNGQITLLGRRLATLPLHPRLGRLMLAAADAGVRRQGAAIAALLSEKDILQRQIPVAGSAWPAGPSPRMQGASDLLLRLDLLEKVAHQEASSRLCGAGIDPIALRQVQRTAAQLLRITRRLEAAERPADEELLLRLPLWAYPDRVARKRANDPSRAVMVGGGGIRLADESIVRQAEFFLALDARHDQRSQSREAVVHLASRIEPRWLEEMFPQEIQTQRGAEYDEQRERVVGVIRVRYRDLVLREDANAAVDAEQAAECLATAAAPRAAEFFAADEPAASWLARLAFLKQHMSEHPWPAADNQQLGQLLAQACRGKRAMDELRRQNLAALLQEMLLYPMDRLFEQHAPETMLVPSGSRIRITYAPGQAPVLAVRLQELFGWIATPRLAAGRVPLVLQLLGPNFRPVQITDDLASFWATTYFQVRKDLRVRYPKHSWPDDPLSALPQARGRHR